MVLGLAAVWMPGVALAQATHGGHSQGVSITRYELLVGIAHGNTLMSTVLLVGLPMFAALIWLPTSRAFGVGRDSAHLFSRCAWALFGLLLVAGLAEVALYAVRYFDEPVGMGIIVQALFGTRVGNIWLMRWGFALVTALMVFWAARKYEISYWWVAAGLGSVTLLTLTQLSHAAARAAAEGRFLPFLWIGCTSSRSQCGWEVCSGSLCSCWVRFAPCPPKRGRRCWFVPCAGSPRLRPSL